MSTWMIVREDGSTLFCTGDTLDLALFKVTDTNNIVAIIKV